MAKYKLKVEGVSNVTPNNKGFIDNVDPTEVYYDSETNTIMLGDGTITEAEPDLTPGITPSDGEVLAYNGISGVWKNTAPTAILGASGYSGYSGMPAPDGISGLTDVSIDNITDKQMLSYNISDEKWENTSNIILGENSTSINHYNNVILGDNIIATTDNSLYFEEGKIYEHTINESVNWGAVLDVNATLLCDMIFTETDRYLVYDGTGLTIFNEGDIIGFRESIPFGQPGYPGFTDTYWLFTITNLIEAAGQTQVWVTETHGTLATAYDDSDWETYSVTITPASTHTAINIGSGNTISHNNSHIIGNNITTDAENTLFVNKLNVSGSVTISDVGDPVINTIDTGKGAATYFAPANEAYVYIGGDQTSAIANGTTLSVYSSDESPALLLGTWPVASTQYLGLSEATKITFTIPSPGMFAGVVSETPVTNGYISYTTFPDSVSSIHNLLSDKITMNPDDSGIVIEGEYIKSAAEAAGGDWSHPYIDLYDDGMDLYVGDTDVYLTQTKIDLTTNNSHFYIRPEYLGIKINDKADCLLQSSNITAGRTWELPNADGTIALTSDIVPTGALTITGYTTDGFCTVIGDDIVIPNNTIRNFSVKGVGVGNEGNKASYTGTPTGCSTPVTISCIYGGVPTSNVRLTGTGQNTINDLISNWNAAVNADRQVYLVSGDGTQIIAERTDIDITGGTNIFRTASYNIVGTAKNISGTVAVKVGNTGVKPTYTGTPDGCATPVTITAAYASAGIPSMKGNGVKTINTLITEYNVYNGLEYPISLISGDGSQVVSNGTKVELTGGTSVPMIDELSNELNINGMSVTVHMATDSMNVIAEGKVGVLINWSAKVEWHDISF